MLLIVVAVMLAVLGLVSFVVLCWGIRRDDDAPDLDQPAPGRSAALARRFTGLLTCDSAVRTTSRRDLQVRSARRGSLGRSLPGGRSGSAPCVVLPAQPGSQP